MASASNAHLDPTWKHACVDLPSKGIQNSLLGPALEAMPPDIGLRPVVVKKHDGEENSNAKEKNDGEENSNAKPKSNADTQKPAKPKSNADIVQDGHLIDSKKHQKTASFAEKIVDNSTEKHVDKSAEESSGQSAAQVTLVESADESKGEASAAQVTLIESADDGKVETMRSQNPDAPSAKNDGQAPLPPPERQASDEASNANQPSGSALDANLPAHDDSRSFEAMSSFLPHRRCSILVFLLNLIPYFWATLELWIALIVIRISPIQLTKHYVVEYCAGLDYDEVEVLAGNQKSKPPEEMIDVSEMEKYPECMPEIFAQLQGCTLKDIQNMDIQCFKHLLPQVVAAEYLATITGCIAGALIFYLEYRNGYPFGCIQYYQMVFFQRQSLAFRITLLWCCLLLLYEFFMGASLRQFGFTASICFSTFMNIKALYPDDRRVPRMLPGDPVHLHIKPPLYNLISNCHPSKVIQKAEAIKTFKSLVKSFCGEGEDQSNPYGDHHFPPITLFASGESVLETIEIAYIQFCHLNDETHRFQAHRFPHFEVLLRLPLSDMPRVIRIFEHRWQYERIVEDKQDWHNVLIPESEDLDAPPKPVSRTMSPLHLAYLKSHAEHNPGKREILRHVLYYGFTHLEIWAMVVTLWLCEEVIGQEYAISYCASEDKHNEFGHFERRIELAMQEVAEEERIASDNCWKHVHDRLLNCTAYNVTDMDMGCFRNTIPTLKAAHDMTIAFTVIATVIVLYQFYRNRYPFGTFQYYRLMMHQRRSLALKFVLFFAFWSFFSMLLAAIELGVGPGGGQTTFVLVMVSSAVLHFKAFMVSSHRIAPGLSDEYPVQIRLVEPWHEVKPEKLDFLDLYDDASKNVKEHLNQHKHINERLKHLKAQKTTFNEMRAQTRTCFQRFHHYVGEGEMKSFSDQLVRPISWVTSPGLIMAKLMSAYVQYSGSKGHDTKDFPVLLTHPNNFPVLITAYETIKATDVNLSGCQWTQEWKN